MIYRK